MKATEKVEIKTIKLTTINSVVYKLVGQLVNLMCDVAKMPEVDICNICKLRVFDRQEGLLCETCFVWKHRECINMSQRSYARISKSTQPWFCDDCQQRDKPNKKINENKTYTLDDVMEKLQVMDQNYTLLFKKFEEQLKINEKLEGELTEIKRKLNKREQAELNNNLIIHGIPEKQNENLLEVINAVGSKLDIPLNATEITAYRLGRENTNDPKQKSRPIKVIFHDMKAKSSLLKSKKRTQLNSKDLGYTINNKVYLNHDLTTANLELYKEAKLYRRDNDYKFIWITGGNIFLRKDEQSKIILVEDKKQLKN